MVNPGIHEELGHFVRALSHDMSAAFMLLDHSFARLKQSLDAPPRPDREQLAAHVEACLRELQRYLDDLAGLAKTGHVALEPRAVDPGTVLDEVLFEQRDAIHARGAQVSVRRPLPPVWCNPHRLKEVFANLLRNALLHGCDRRAPAVTISAKAITGPADSRLVAIRVHDNGHGIEPRFHEEIFLPGRRLRGSSAEGSGMGLAIVRRTVEHYGGRAYVDPRCRSGTAILFCLPTAAQADSTRESRRPESSGVARQGRNLEADSPHETGELRPHQSLAPAPRPSPLR